MTGLIEAVNTLTGKPALIPAHYLNHPAFKKNYKAWSHGKKSLIAPIAPKETKPKRRATLAKKED